MNEIIVSYPENDYRYYLEHHGIAGQKWGGVRKAPWYPISDYKTHLKRSRSNNKNVALKIYKNATRHEPAITKDLKSIVDKTNGRMYGLENRLKTKESILRKLNLGKEIKDASRYTVISSERDFVKNYNKIKQDLEQSGYTETRCKNYFEDYKLGKVKHKSVQCNFKTKDGYEFEIQFHTKRSQDVKNKKIPLYEEIRQPNVKESRKEELIREMETLAEGIKDPAGISLIKSH